MKTLIINEGDEQGLKTVAAALREGKLVAFPTETVYGLGANALDAEAVKKIYQAKGRPADNPLIVHIAGEAMLKDLVENIPAVAYKLMQAFWPGPLTLVFKKSYIVPDIITGGLDTVAIRMPENLPAKKLIEEAGVPVAAPSANLSGHPSPTNARHVEQDLSGRIDYIIDGGQCRVGIESTVLDITSHPPVLLRPGGITHEMLEKVAGRVEIDRILSVKDNIRPRSPGMKYRHYSPQADMILVKGETEKVAAKINALAAEHRSAGLKVGVLTSSENAGLYGADVIIPVGSVNNPKEIASMLFESLRRFDETKVDIIYSEVFSEKGLGRAVMNRLKKAAAGKIIEV